MLDKTTAANYLDQVQIGNFAYKNGVDLRITDPGHYTADLILTDAGFHKMRFFGNAGATQINETFNSEGGGGGFGDV